tara:strand:+ start:176 stop:466 length:291 start_codon:yes stop_codon:yes gene_type:complete
LQSIDISDALDKVVDYFDTTDEEDPSVSITSGKPFALRMRMYKFIKSYNEQMKVREEIDENKYSQLKIKATDTSVEIRHALDNDELQVITHKGDTL